MMKNKIVLILTLLVCIIGCATYRALPPELVQRIVKEIPASEGEVRFYGEGVYCPNWRGFSTRIPFSNNFPDAIQGVLAITTEAILFQRAVQQTNTFEMAFRLPLTDLYSASLDIYGRNREIIIQKKDYSYHAFEFAQPESIFIDIPKTEAAAAFLKEQVSMRKESRVAKSDIDEPPITKVRADKKSFAVVIGIENYRRGLPRANFAGSDARLVSDYLSKALGYPEENIVMLLNENATHADITKYLEQWLGSKVDREGTVFVYYSGHGAPNARTGDAYLVPYDGDPAFIEKTGYSLKKMYTGLGRLPAKEIIVALDSCFSGAGDRSVIAEGTRPLVMNLESTLLIPKNMTLLAASSGNQISSTYKEKGHGLFTYFLLKGIKNEDVVRQDGSIIVDDLFMYMKPQVERIARKEYNNEQSPQLFKSKAR